MSNADFVQVPVKLTCRYGEITCHNQVALKTAINSAMPSGVDSVHFRLLFNTESGERALDFTYSGEEKMHETYGSRPALDFELLLSRIHWDSHNNGN